MNKDTVFQECFCKVINILIALFCEPDKEIIHNQEVYDVLIVHSEKISQDLHELSLAIKDSAFQYSQEEILVDYSKLFLGPFTTIAPPYGSVYLDNNVLMGDSTQSVLNYYNECGLKFDEDLKDLPDNIVVELEFIYFLLFNRLNLYNENNLEGAEQVTIQLKYFTEKYFNSWVIQFCARIINGIENGFYVNLAKYLKSIINMIK